MPRARLSVAAGLPRLTPHGLRHSFATAALKARVPVEGVAARLGNTARVVQEVYQHVIPADDAAAARLVGDLFRAEQV
jgi:integrase